MKKLIATFLAAIMLVPVAMATTLGEFPGFLATKTDTTSRVNAYVITGDHVDSYDVLAGIDLATRIAELNYDVVSVPGGVAIGCEYGKCKKAEVPLNDPTNTVADLMGAELTTSIGLGPKKITYDGKEYLVTEIVGVPDAPVGAGDSSLNGSISIGPLSKGDLYYTLDFEQCIDASGFSYTKPLIIKLLGTEFQITSIADDSFTALTGSVGLAESTTPTGVTYGEYTVYVIDGESHSWAQVVIKDSAGNQLASDIINVNTTGTFNIGTTTLKVKVIDVWGSAISGRVSAKLVVGTEVDKQYTDDEPFPGYDLWLFDIEKDASENCLDYITLNYAPNETENEVVPLKGKIVAPNNYFEFGLQDLTVKTFTKVTFSADTATVYENETATRSMFSNKPAIKIEATDYVFNNQNARKAYVTYDGTNYCVAYYNEVLGRIIKDACDDEVDDLPTIDGVFDTHDFTITLLYDGTDPTIFTGLELEDEGTETVTMNYTFTSTAVRLGATTSAEAGDVVDWYSDPVGDYEGPDLTSSFGSVLKANIKTNAGNQKVVVELPAEQQKAFVYMGKIGEVTEEGGTYNKMVSVLTPIAKTTIEAEKTEKTTTKAFVLVGGPCANSLVKDLAEAGLLKDKDGVTLTCDGWIGTGRNFGLIAVVDDAYGVTGKTVLVVAGTRAEDTRLAAQYLQADKLKGSRAKAVEVTGTSVATATVETIA